MNLRQNLTFGFEQTFTTPDWWMDPGFVATSNTPLKIEKMRQLADNIARVIGGKSVQSEDIYKHIQFEVFHADGKPSFVVTMDPGSIEVKTPALLVDEIESTMRPLFEAADRSELVPYRNWWYGIKGGTEGGCHVNMAGFSPETNPLRADPSLVIKYAAFFHNNPWIHYPFMGVDVGPGGNCMRMDEHELDPHSKHAPGTFDSQSRFEALSDRINQGEAISAEQVEAHFKGCKLAEDKHSAPSLYKFKAPLFFIEDRAVEALRSSEDFFLVAELRVKILEYIKSKPVPKLKSFGADVHQWMLTSEVLWEGFEKMCATLAIDASPYRRFFDRQFPRLSMGTDVPSDFEVREGRKPRVITDIKMRGTLIISKTIDTSHGRLEIVWPDNGRICKIDGVEVEARTVGSKRIAYVDYHRTSDEMTLAIEVGQKARFHLKSMMFSGAAAD